MAMANAQNCLPVLQQCMEKWSTQITCHSHCTWITNQECRHQRQIWDGSNCDDSYGNMWWNMYIMYNVYTTVVFFILYFFYVFWYPPTFATSTELMNQSIFPFSICIVAMPDKKKITNPPTLPVEGDIWAASNAPQACVVWGFNSGDWYGSLAWIYAIWHTEGQPNRNIHTGNWSRYYKLNIFVMSIQYQHVRLLVYHYVQMYILHIHSHTHSIAISHTHSYTSTVPCMLF